MLAGSLSVATVAAASALAGPLALEGARLGLTMGEWKALSPPPGASEDTRASCVAASATDVGLQPLSGEARGVTVCGYVSGPESQPETAPLFGAYRAENLRYLFAGDRLVEVDCTTSADAYVDLVARFKKLYGAPAETIRDSFQTPIGSVDRVRRTWRRDGGEIEIVDPTPRLTELAVRLSAAGTNAPRHASARDPARRPG